MYEKVVLESGSLFIREGEASYDVYIVVSGTARATRIVKGKLLTVAYFTKGDVIGDHSLLMGGPRSATVEALSALELIKVRFESPLTESTSQDVRFLSFVLKHLISRVRQFTDKILALETAMEVAKIHRKALYSREYVIAEIQRFLSALIVVMESADKDSDGTFSLEKLRHGLDKIFGKSFLELAALLEALQLFTKSSPERLSISRERITSMLETIVQDSRYLEFLQLGPQEIEILFHVLSYLNQVIEGRQKLEKSPVGEDGDDLVALPLSEIKALTELSRQPSYYSYLRSLQRAGWLGFEADTGILKLNIASAEEQFEIMQFLKLIKLPIFKRAVNE